MNFIGSTSMARGAVRLLFVALAALLPAVAGAAEAQWRNTVQADLVTRLNPDGVMVSVGGYRRRITGRSGEAGAASSYLQVGGALGGNPAYGQASLHAEWQPAPFATLRAQYDLYRFFGANGALLSFSRAGERFGREQISSRAGKEEQGWGHRIMVQPTLAAALGDFVVRNRSDLCYYRFAGTGPWFYEWEYDTLLKDGGLMVDNRSELLYEAWRGAGTASLLAGPFYEITRSPGAGLTRQRAGGELFWMPAETLWSLNRPRIYGRAGANLQDRNRQGELFALFGIGFDYDL